jgi:hypothetical protein
MPTVNSITNQIQKRGQPLIIRRVGAPDLPVIGVVRGYAAVELIGNIQQGDREVRISNGEILETSWPGPPMRTDKVIIEGRQVTVQSVETRYLKGTIALHILQVRG